MTAAALVEQCRAGGRWQVAVNAFVDEFRSATTEARRAAITERPVGEDRWCGLVAAVVSQLGRDCGVPVPDWVAETGSPEPFFAFPASGFALRLRLMLESPPAFRVRNVFVPRNYLSRA